MHKSKLSSRKKLHPIPTATGDKPKAMEMPSIKQIVLLKWDEGWFCASPQRLSIQMNLWQSTQHMQPLSVLLISCSHLPRASWKPCCAPDSPSALGLPDCATGGDLKRLMLDLVPASATQRTPDHCGSTAGAGDKGNAWNKTKAEPSLLPKCCWGCSVQGKQCQPPAGKPTWNAQLTAPAETRSTTRQRDGHRVCWLSLLTDIWRLN